MIKYLDKEITANQAAKSLIEDALINVQEYYIENICLDIELLSEDEREKINHYILDISEKIIKKLNIKQ